MKKNRLVALVMVCAMALSLLTGCGGSSSSGSTGGAAEYSAENPMELRLASDAPAPGGGGAAALVGATAANAPWLGTAVLAYGAYKATSAWVWPIVTKARKNAREEKKAHPKVKTKFVDHLREATSDIFNKKEERKKYFKEAAWSSAAGLVGLGAAGMVGAAAGAVAAKSAQSLSSLAVNSVNNAIETIGTLKNKDKGFWDKNGKIKSVEEIKRKSKESR